MTPTGFFFDASSKKTEMDFGPPAARADTTSPKEKARAMAKKSYDDERTYEAGRRRATSLTGRDIGSIPEIKSTRRRARCKNSLAEFCRTYNPEAFQLDWSDDHRRVIARIEEAVTHRALFALAMPRGAGKTTICRMATLWALSYAHCRYVFVIGATAGKAEDTLDALKIFIRFLPDFGDDFPEVSYPAQCLGGIANRAAGQLCQERPTLIEWGKDRLTLATVPVPPNWPASWPRRADGMAPTSGAVVAASGLTGDGLRGSLLALPTGEQVRPDLVLLDDPQTPESAHSPSQNNTREQLVSADVLGMAGPGKSISAVMPCTVIAKGDFVDRILDRKKHPLWRGERTKMLRSMPRDMAAWDRYFEVYSVCAQAEPPSFEKAAAYYGTHQAELEAGAEASWLDRFEKGKGEVSAIQHAMHLWFRDPIAFMSEYQNDPQDNVAGLADELTADTLGDRINRHERGLVPGQSSRLTAFIDASQEILWWAVCAWEDTFTGSVIDYGAWPDQRRSYFTLRDANPTVQQATGIGSVEGSLRKGLESLTHFLLDRHWQVDGGGRLKIERCLIDSGWQAKVVRRFCRESAHAAILTPSKGYAITASALPMSEWAKRPGQRRGLDWIIQPPVPGEGQLLLFDVNAWKSFLHSRLSTPLGERGAMSLFGDLAVAHRMLFDHLLSEKRVETQGRGRRLFEWKLPPAKPDNHWLDCLTGCAVAASVAGVGMSETATPAVTRKRVSFAEMQQAARQRR